VSAMGRDHVGINTFENFIQTDAAINPGNSGGALIDTRGNLIGINTAIYSNNGVSMGIGFAISINLVKQVMESIISTGRVTRGWIGVEPQNLSAKLIQSLGVHQDISGVLVSGVMSLGPADKAGIKPGDIICFINSKKILDTQSLLNFIAQQKPGTEIVVTIIRNNKAQDFRLHVTQRSFSK